SYGAKPKNYTSFSAPFGASNLCPPASLSKFRYSDFFRHWSLVISHLNAGMNTLNLKQDLRAEYDRLTTSSWFLRQCSVRLGSVALASLLGPDKAGAVSATKDRKSVV